MQSFSQHPDQSHPAKGERSRGQALAETALVMVFLLLLLSAIVDFGRAMFTWLAMQNAAAEGALYAANFSDPTRVGTVGTTDPETVIYRTQHESPDSASLLDWTTPGVGVSVTYDPVVTEPRPQPGTRVTVAITYPLEFIGPLPGLFGLSQMTLYAEATNVVLNNNSDH